MLGQKFGERIGMAKTSDVSMGLDLTGLEFLFGGVSASGGV